MRALLFACLGKYAQLQCDLICFALYVNVCAYGFACVHVCPNLSVFSSNAYITCWAKRNRWANTEQRRTSLEAFFCFCGGVCVQCARMWGLTTEAHLMSWSTLRVCSVDLGGHKLCWWLSCFSKMCNLPPARQINQCLPHTRRTRHPEQHQPQHRIQPVSSPNLFNTSLA